MIPLPAFKFPLVPFKFLIKVVDGFQRLPSNWTTLKPVEHTHRPLTPEQKFVRTLYIGILSTSKPMASFAKWVLTGVAAILGLLIANADSVTNIISEGCFRWGMILMALSLIPSVVSINTSIAIEMTMATMESLYTRFFSPEGLSDLLAMKAEPEEVMEEIIKPFPEFLKPWLRRRKVQTDSLAMERRCLRLLQIQMASGLCFYALSVLGMVILVVGI